MEILEKPHSGEIYDPVSNNVQEIQARCLDLLVPVKEKSGRRDHRGECCYCGGARCDTGYSRQRTVRRAPAVY